MRHEFHPEALAEYEAAALYYAERGPALGQRFVAAVDDAIDRILDAPTRWRVLEQDVRRCLTRVFPPTRVVHHRAGFRSHRCRHALQPRARLLETSRREALTRRSIGLGVERRELTAGRSALTR